MRPTVATHLVKKTAAKAKMSIPLSAEDQAQACRLSFDYVKNIDGGALEFQLLLDASQDKPAFWEDFKSVLKELGFQLKSGFGLEDDEIFLIGSFVAADIGISGVKQYGPEDHHGHLSDVSRILEWMQAQVPATAVYAS